MHKMRRRGFLAVAFAAPFLPLRHALAQAAPPVVAYLGIETGAARPEFDAFMAGMRQLGHADGGDVVIDVRMVPFRAEELARAAAALVARKPAVLVASQPTLDAARAATATIPIVARMTYDPVASGLVKSLARPDGNLTGVSSYSSSLYGKRLEIAKELIPGLGRVAILHADLSPTWNKTLALLQADAKTLALDLVPVLAHRPEDLPAAFDAAAAAGAGAMLPIRSPVTVGSRVQIALLAAAHRLPAVYDDREFCEAGGLISYGADLRALHRRLAYFVDRILHGAAPAELPIEEPTVFELVVNAGAAKALGLILPPALLVRADQVID